MTRQERSMGDIFFAALFNPPATIAFRICRLCAIYPYSPGGTLHLESFRKSEFSSQCFFTQLVARHRNSETFPLVKRGKGRGSNAGLREGRKVGSDIGMGTYEYREEREDEVRCRVGRG